MAAVIILAGSPKQPAGNDIVAELTKKISEIQEELTHNPYFSFYIVDDIYREGVKEPLLKRGTRIDLKKAGTIIRTLGDIPILYSDKKLQEVKEKKRITVTRADWLCVEKAMRSRMKNNSESRWGIPIIDRQIFDDMVLEIEDEAPEELVGIMKTLKDRDCRLYRHCFMTGFIAAGLGIILHDQRENTKPVPGRSFFTDNEIFILASGGFLHEIGDYIPNDSVKMSRIQKKQLEKWLETNETGLGERIRNAYTGFLYINSRKVFSTLTAHILIEMNERFDGSGFPEHKSGRNIHEFARIVAIAERFSELWSGFEGEFIEQKDQLKLTLHALMKGLSRDQNGKLQHREFDYELIMTMLELFK